MRAVDFSGFRQFCAVAVMCLGALVAISDPAAAQAAIKRIPTQYIAALGDPEATSGTGADSWGLWAVDPGPRGVSLSNFKFVQDAGGMTPAHWSYDQADWWMEEHGLIMEQPKFPIPPGKYVVTGGREATATLTIDAKGSDGVQHWSLDDGAKLYDVTHLRCRSARYTPQGAGGSCTPEKAQSSAFPVEPGGPMPAVPGCNKQDYTVLIVIGMVAD